MNENYNDDDEIIFFEDDSSEHINSRETTSHRKNNGFYKVLIVDDEEEVHIVTKMVLSDFTFENKNLQFLSAYNYKSAVKIINQNSDLAVILMDVVMEEEDTGLKLVKYIRQECNNSFVRIILRTGQPGQAPEKKVILEYDINDYKEKTELTAQKLFTTMVSSLRSYRDIIKLGESKKGLEKIIQSSYSIFEMQSLKKFASEVLNQVISIASLNEENNKPISGLCASYVKDDFVVLAAKGIYSDFIGKNLKEVVHESLYGTIMVSSQNNSNYYNGDKCIISFQNDFQCKNIILIQNIDILNEIERDLIDIFSTNVSIAFDNIYLNKEVENTQKEVIFTLGEIAEARSKETGNHVRRVAEYSRILALEYGLSLEEASVIKMASPMHDVGKLAIPDEILNKPAKLTPDEFEIMKNHSLIGYDMLKNSNKRLLKSAAVIALEHHEKYNGFGYPYGLKGEDIHIYGRITAIADVFDALGSKRVYKKAWSDENIINYFKEQRGEHFDPKLVDILMNNLDEFLNVRETLKDKENQG